MQDVKAGDVIGRYTLAREISKGFPGTLWLLNFQHEGERMLALGRIVPFSESISEATWAALTESAWDAMEVDHECVASAADVVFETARLLTVYDYSEGEPLTVLDRLKTVQNTPFPAQVAMRVVVDLLDGLEAHHTTSQQLGAVGAFGGVGPDSLLVGTDGCTRLLDVYVAGAASEEADLRMLPERVRYVAPEQFAGEAVDARADIYAAGCVLWELLANRRLHIGAPKAVERRVRLGQLPPLRPVSPVQDSVIEAVHKALKPDRRHRFESAAAMAAELRAAATDIADRSDVAEFVGKLASRQLATRRKVTEQSTIARLRDLLDSRPPPRAMRRSAAPPKPQAASALGPAPAIGAPAAVAPSVGLSGSSQVTAPGIGSPKSLKSTLLGIPSPVPPANPEPEEDLPLPTPEDSEGPTLTLSTKQIASALTGSQAVPPADPAAVSGLATGGVSAGSRRQGTLLGMPAPDTSPAPDAAVGISLNLEVRSPVGVPQLEQEEPALLADPLSSSFSPVTEPTSPEFSQETIDDVPVDEPVVDSKTRNWQPVIWAFVGSSFTLAVVIIVMVVSREDEEAAAPSQPAASQPAASQPAAKPKAPPVSVAQTAQAKVEPETAAEPEAEPEAETEAVPEEEAVPVEKPPAPRSRGSVRKRSRPKKKPTKFVPDEL